MDGGLRPKGPFLAGASFQFRGSLCWLASIITQGRWKRALLNKINAAGAAFDDALVSPVIRQTLLHWAFEVSAKDLEKHRSS